MSIFDRLFNKKKEDDEPYVSPSEEEDNSWVSPSVSISISDSGSPSVSPSASPSVSPSPSPWEENCVICDRAGIVREAGYVCYSCGDDLCEDHAIRKMGRWYCKTCVIEGEM